MGSTVVSTGAGGYFRKHNPWVEFDNVPSAANMPFAGHFPDSLHYDDLPTVSIVVPNQNHDMHDGTVAAGDTWLQTYLDPYVDWAFANNSLFILTFDEDNGSTVGNDILTLLVGPMIRPGVYDQTINHHHLLRTVEDMYDLGYAGNSANVEALTMEAFIEVPEANPAAAPVILGGITGLLWMWRRRTAASRR